MPRVSERQKLLRSMRMDLYLSIITLSSSSSTDSDMGDSSSNSSFDGMNLLEADESNPDADLEDSTDSEMEGDDIDANPSEIMEHYFVMDLTRYFVERPMTNKSNDFAENFFANLPAKMFRQITRMDKNTFFALVDAIKDHRIFHNESTIEQAPVIWQLAVTLDRLGHDGNGACLNHMIPTWGVSNGSLVNFTGRCFTALEHALAEHLKWPDRHERAFISQEFAAKGFPSCVGLIDGTLIPLSQRPKESGECYYDRKCRYSINTQVICDHKRKILYIFTGMPGTVSDLTCLKRSKLWRKCVQDGGSLFDEGQYLLGDSGYQASQYFVTAFKKWETSQDREDFNTCVAKCRVTNEHCIGVLKSRWFSLKEMRIQLKNTSEHVRFVRWVGICARLHNFVMSRNDDWTIDDDDIIDDDVEAVEVEREEPVGRRRQSSPTATLDAAMATALAFHRQPGGFLNEDWTRE